LSLFARNSGSASPPLAHPNPLAQPELRANWASRLTLKQMEDKLIETIQKIVKKMEKKSKMRGKITKKT